MILHSPSTAPWFPEGPSLMEIKLVGPFLANSLHSWALARYTKELMARRPKVYWWWEHNYEKEKHISLDFDPWFNILNWPIRWAAEECWPMCEDRWWKLASYYLFFFLPACVRPSLPPSFAPSLPPSLPPPSLPLELHCTQVSCAIAKKSTSCIVKVLVENVI